MTTVLYIDDNETNRFLLLALLQRSGFEVLAAADGKEGIDMAAAQRPDLVLMDIEMPGMSGIEATRRLKAMPETKDIPVIALSAHDDRKRMSEARAAGCAAYVLKPLNLPVLLGKIQEVLGPLDVEHSPGASRRSRA